MVISQKDFISLFFFFSPHFREENVADFFSACISFAMEMSLHLVSLQISILPYLFFHFIYAQFCSQKIILKVGSLRNSFKTFDVCETLI